MTGPNDYDAVSNMSVTFAPSEMEAIAEFTVVNDNTMESFESFNVTMETEIGSPSGLQVAQSAAIITITDDDSEPAWI